LIEAAMMPKNVISRAALDAQEMSIFRDTALHGVRTD